MIHSFDTERMLLCRHEEQVMRSRLLCLSSRRLVRQSRERVVSGRRLVGRRRMICGGSETGLRESIRLRLTTGTLSRLDGRAWAGPATGKGCIVCQATIDRPDIEYEIQDPYHAYAHLTCFTIWLDESRVIPRARRSVAPIRRRSSCPRGETA
jgi:hypothetical protein